LFLLPLVLIFIIIIKIIIKTRHEQRKLKKKKITGLLSWQGIKQKSQEVLFCVAGALKKSFFLWARSFRHLYSKGIKNKNCPEEACFAQ
jgi:hypothetical protein